MLDFRICKARLSYLLKKEDSSMIAIDMILKKKRPKKQNYRHTSFSIDIEQFT